MKRAARWAVDCLVGVVVVVVLVVVEASGIVGRDGRYPWEDEE